MKNTSLFVIQDELVKNIIKDTIETYSGQWRIIHEAIQNSHDAIQRNPNIRKGTVSIDLHLGTNRVVVSDNGVGISIDKFKNVFLLGGSDKMGDENARKILKGSQGVGIKATLFTSEFFKVTSVNENRKWEVELKDCYKFLDPTFDGTLPEPKAQNTNAPSETVLEYILHEYTVVDFLNEIIEEYFEEIHYHEENVASIELSEDKLLHLLEVYFRTKTYIGCVQALLGINKTLKPVDVNLTLHLDSPSLSEHTNMQVKNSSFLSKPENHGKVFRTGFEGKYLDIASIHSSLEKKDRVDKLFTSFQDVLENPPSETMKKLLIQKFDTDQAKRLLYRFKHSEDGRIFEPDNTLLQKHSRVISMLNGIYLIIGPRPYISKYFSISTKQLLSVNGLPTNIVLNPPRGALSYLNNVHILIDVDTKLGLGKRNIPGRTMGLINNFFVDVWSMLRKVAPTIVGIREGKDPAELKVWDKEKEYEKYTDAKNFLRTTPLFYKTIPEEEQEVIALFFELLGRKIITGYYPFRLGSSSVYDGLFYIEEKIKSGIPSSFQPRLLKTIEFKYKLSGLLQDFDEESKHIEDIDLVICWENDCSDDTEYTISSLERDNIAPLPAASLRIRRATKSCQVIVLKDFLKELEY
jgi:hypothetical protein